MKKYDSIGSLISDFKNLPVPGGIFIEEEKIEELKKQKQEKQAEYDHFNKITPEEIWLNELNILEEKYNKFYKRKIDLVKQSMSEKKTKKSKK